MYNCIIMGAAGRDFHNFRSFFLDRPEFRVCAFTATQIPFITERSYPRELAGEGYFADIPIHDESELESLIVQHGADFVFFSYSDLAHEEVMHKAARVQAAGASFVLLGPGQTSLESRKPVVAVTATRTGAGKSPLTQYLALELKQAGIRVVTVRHPMPYGNLRAQAVQRFASAADLDHHQCTIEEREEYEPYVRQDLVIYAGVDYAAILSAAEDEADIVLWDGGNNDFAFFKPDLNIVVCDALRAGHGLMYYPGETNFRAADVLVVNKVAQASPDSIQTILDLKAQLNPAAHLVQSDLEVCVDEPEDLAGRRVLIVEDGPTVTHGGMSYGAGWVAAQQCRVGEIVDPRPHAVGSIASTFAAYPHLQRVLPAMTGAERVINASPADIGALLGAKLPVVQVRYQWVQRSGVSVLEEVQKLLS
jgi:predicted GTPase